MLDRTTLLSYRNLLLINPETFIIKRIFMPEINLLVGVFFNCYPSILNSTGLIYQIKSSGHSKRKIFRQ